MGGQAGAAGGLGQDDGDALAVNPNFGLGLWLGSPFDGKRERMWGPQSEPFLADDVRFMQGGGYRTVYIVPSKQLVILRHGKEVPDWDNAALVNAVLRRK